MNIGEKIFELRKQKNLSQEEVADKLNVSRQTISKWETNQSTPDFDKIVPLCELFEISTDELLKGIKEKDQEVKEPKIITKQDVREKTAKVISTSVFTYIAAVAVFLFLVCVLGVNAVAAIVVFLIMVGFATASIINNYLSRPKFDKTNDEKKEETILKQVNVIIGTICTIIYFIVSFTTMAWHITWIIFIIDGVICQIVKLVFMLNQKEEEIHE